MTPERIAERRAFLANRIASLPRRSYERLRLEGSLREALHWELETCQPEQARPRSFAHLQLIAWTVSLSTSAALIGAMLWS